MIRHVVRLAAAALAVAAAGLVVPQAAQASACGTGSGVTVVVDFHQLRGLQTVCDSGGAGENAEQQLADAGFSITLVDGEDFVCRIDDKPVTDCSRTPPSNAYWSLWWSDGKTGEWKYSSVGAGSLKVPAGGYVGFSWQGQSQQAQPRVSPGAPATSAPTSAPTSSATPRPSAGAHHSSAAVPAPATSTAPSDSGSSATAAVTPTSRATGQEKHRAGHAKKSRHHRSSKAGSQRGQAAGTVAAVASGPGGAGGSGSGGLPGWVPPVAIAVLFAGTGTFLLVRRRSSGGG